tara:strand:- start:11 stop:154 length:144 start_codon:yes stop_codon:yes gene_type:complete
VNKINKKGTVWAVALCRRKSPYCSPGRLKIVPAYALTLEREEESMKV